MASRPAPALACVPRPTDGELVRQALEGRSWAFDALMTRHMEHLRRLIAKRLRRCEDVLDVLQEAQLAAWRALHSYDPSRPFEAWLSSIAINKCRDWGRRGAVRARLMLQVRDHAALWNLALREPAPEHVLISRESALELQRGLERLPFRFREPLLLTAIRELSHSEAGQVLGLTTKAIENRVRRARQMLAKSLRVADDPEAA